ncbi:Putative L,D-transpeptidase YciB [Anaerolineales bacterium]|nr:Putative L,D-transpeptidase YciB [Anaerolineales bacterium]
MNERFIESRKVIANAREALKRGDMTQARQLAEYAAELAPKSEEPWLILAAVASPRESVNYIRKALEVNPDSPRAKKGMEWAMQRLGEKPGAGISPENTQPIKSLPKRQAPRVEAKSPKKRSRLLPILLIVMGCGVFAFAAWSAVTSPVLASILNFAATPQVESKPFAQVNIPKPQPMVQVTAPTVTPIPPTEVAVEAQPTSESVAEVAVVPPTAEPTLEVATLPTDAVPPPTASQPEATGEPGAVSAEIVADTPTPEFTEPTAAPNIPPQVAGNGERWIDVDLSQQRVYAYEGDVLMNSFIVSTGTWQTPTVTGEFRIWVKVRSQAMTGPGYYLPDVPYVMYFYKDYGLHGTYWHNNFGTPMSHGCVNLTIPDAEWLYNFASVGTVVNVHN